MDLFYENSNKKFDIYDFLVILFLPLIISIGIFFRFVIYSKTNEGWTFLFPNVILGYIILFPQYNQRLENKKIKNAILIITTILSLLALIPLTSSIEKINLKMEVVLLVSPLFCLIYILGLRFIYKKYLKILPIPIGKWEKIGKYHYSYNRKTKGHDLFYSILCFMTPAIFVLLIYFVQTYCG